MHLISYLFVSSTLAFASLTRKSMTEKTHFKMPSVIKIENPGILIPKTISAIPIIMLYSFDDN